MPFAYKIYNQEGVYFVTFTTHQWVDVFTRNCYRDILVNSLIHCQKQKGLNIYSWVIMSNHMHLIISSNKNKLTDIIRDYKKFTASAILKEIAANPEESRKRWLLWLLTKDQNAVFWQEGYHGEEIYSEKFYQTKERYIHLNPVRVGLVLKEEDYVYSSCRRRYGLEKGQVELAEY